MNSPIDKILIIEDNESDVVLIREMLDEVAQDLTVASADNLSSGLAALAREDFDVLLLDLGLPDSRGIDTFLAIQSGWAGLPIIVLTGFADEELAANAISRGAQDYLVKGKIDGGLLLRSMRYAVERMRAGEQFMRLSRRTEMILESAGEGIFGVDAQGNHTFINRTAAAMLGYEVREMIGKNGHEIYHHSRPDGSFYPENECPISATHEDGAEHSGEELFWRKDGSSFPVDFTSRPLIEGNRIVGAVVTFRDISERKQAETTRAYLSAIVESTSAAIISLTKDPSGIIQTWNRGAERVYGYAAAEVVGRHISILVPPDHPNDVPYVLERVRRGEMVERYETVRMRKDGKRIHVAIDVSPIRDPNGRILGASTIAHDITERRRLEEEMRHMAQHDALTNLPNRRLLMDILNVSLADAQRRRRKVAVLFLDLDRFKEVNDTLGHEAGDLLLKEAASRLKANVRKADTIARIGGDEFNLILADMTRPEDTAEIARNIVSAFRKPFLIAGHELHATTSIGISIYPDDSPDVETLLRYADIAMYHAKENGRNTYRFYNPSINVRSIEKMKLESYLRQTIARGELSVHYQPQIDIKTERIFYAEALVRWNHPDRGLLEPREFLPLAEETGFITAIDEWVLRTACVQARAWKDSGLDSFCVTVNLSARQFQSPDLVTMISTVLRETGIPPSCLDIEVTETTVMSNIEQTASQLRELAGMGVHISIDDFGTGYSSLNYLKKLPIERIKIDKSFVQDIARDPDDRVIISAVTSMARKMGIRTVAEGVETQEQFAFVKEAGCDEMQGFLVSRPVPAEQFRDMILPRGAGTA